MIRLKKMIYTTCFAITLTSVVPASSYAAEKYEDAGFGRPNWDAPKTKRAAQEMLKERSLAFSPEERARLRRERILREMGPEGRRQLRLEERRAKEYRERQRRKREHEEDLSDASCPKPGDPLPRGWEVKVVRTAESGKSSGGDWDRVTSFLVDPAYPDVSVPGEDGDIKFLKTLNKAVLEQRRRRVPITLACAYEYPENDSEHSFLVLNKVIAVE